MDSTMGKFAPSPSGVRKPTDNSKRNGMFHNPPRHRYFGGAPGAPQQAGTKGWSAKSAEGQRADGPITDRGKGRSR